MYVHSSPIPETNTMTRAAARRRIAFDAFVFDLESRDLTKEQTPIALEDKPARALQILLERAGEIVLVQELREALWPARIHIDFEHAIHKIMNKVRVALEDDVRSPTYIRTISKRGYRFVGRTAIAPLLPQRVHIPVDHVYQDAQ
jgi:DNA-binding winged helix-turn-helix (wHTH) protein